MSVSIIYACAHIYILHTYACLHTCMHGHACIINNAGLSRQQSNVTVNK